MKKFIRSIDFSDVSLYAVTGGRLDPRALLAHLEKLLRGGVDAFQLRTRDLTDRDLIQLAKDSKDLCHQHDALFIVDNRADIALAVDADGVHLGHTDLPLSDARQILGHRKIIGASTHSLPQALAAQKEGADYVSCGPLWATPTKPTYEPVGTSLIGLYRAALKVPFVAIGGINESNIDEVVAAGATRVAIVRALMETDDPQQKAQFFKTKVRPSLESKHKEFV